MSTTAPSRRSPRLRYLLRLGVGALILALLVSRLPLGELLQAVGRVRPALWPAAVLLFLAVHAIGAGKWRLLTSAAGARLGAIEALRCHYYGLFGNLFLPSVVGGDVVRAGLAMQLGQPRAPLLLGSLVDRGLDVAALVVLAGVGALGAPAALAPRSRGLFLALGAIAALAALAAALLLWALPARRFPFRWRRRLAKARQALVALARRPGRLAGALLLALLTQGALLALNAWLGYLVGVRSSPLVWLLVWPLAKLAALLPVTQGGIGVREAAMVTLFRPFGVDAVAAVAAGLAFEVLIVGGGLLGGLAARLLGAAAARATPPRSS